MKQISTSETIILFFLFRLGYACYTLLIATEFCYKKIALQHASLTWERILNVKRLPLHILCCQCWCITSDVLRRWMWVASMVCEVYVCYTTGRHQCLLAWWYFLVQCGPLRFRRGLWWWCVARLRADCVVYVDRVHVMYKNATEI